MIERFGRDDGWSDNRSLFFRVGKNGFATRCLNNEGRRVQMALGARAGGCMEQLAETLSHYKECANIGPNKGCARDRRNVSKMVSSVMRKLGAAHSELGECLQFMNRTYASFGHYQSLLGVRKQIGDSIATTLLEIATYSAKFDQNVPTAGDVIWAVCLWADRWNLVRPGFEYGGDLDVENGMGSPPQPITGPDSEPMRGRALAAYARGNPERMAEFKYQALVYIVKVALGWTGGGSSCPEGTIKARVWEYVSENPFRMPGKRGTRAGIELYSFDGEDVTEDAKKT